MATVAQVLDEDGIVALAAQVLAHGQGRQDGWCRAEDLASLVVLEGAGHGETAGDRPDVQRWAQRLDELLRQRPTLRLAVDGDQDYPLNLRSVRGRPALLFIDGSIDASDRRAVAIVGSRQAPGDTIEATAKITVGLVAAGYTIVSGLARGVDSTGHRAALDAGGRTIAVVGTGIDEVFPPENAGLLERIRHAGAVVSQFPPGHGPTKTTFPARNAVIAGLSLGSVVVTASERSGTRIEIDRTLAQHRPVFLWEPFLGNQRWARELARSPLVHIVRSAADIDDVLGRNAAA